MEFIILFLFRELIIGTPILFKKKNIIFANKSNNDSYGKEKAERLPLQRLDLESSPEVEGILKEAASIFEGGENSSSQIYEGNR